MTFGKTKDGWKDNRRFGKTKISNLIQRESGKQGGAVEACWAHNPKVDRSRLSPAILARVAKWIRRPASKR